MTERIQKDFFTEPSYASVTAVKTGPVEVADNIDKSDKGEVSPFHSLLYLCTSEIGSSQKTHGHISPFSLFTNTRSPCLKRSVLYYSKKFAFKESTMQKRIRWCMFRSIRVLIRIRTRIIVGLRVRWLPFL